MNYALRIVLLFLLVLPLPLRVHSQTAAAPTAVDPAISNLAGQLSTSLQSAGKKRVVVLDIRGPQKEIHPVGTWLADQLSSALKMSAADLEVVDRTELKDHSEPDENSPGPGTPGQKLVQRGRSVGADAVVTGSFAKISQKLGITLLITNLSRSGGLIPSIRGATPITDEIRNLSPEAIPAFKGEFFQAGVAGISTPTCTHCPQPHYSDEARKAKYQGDVLLNLVATAEGHTDKIVVISGPGKGLEEKSIEAVKKWRFDPARDLDGKLVATKVQVQVTFRLYGKQP